ncbi:hypothetical protein ACVWWG_000029 [Bradyrhizobium sp. LB7.2]
MYKAAIRAGVEGVFTPEGIAAVVPDLILKVADRVAAREAIRQIKIKFWCSGIHDFCDKLQPYLVLRVRGHSASWLVKTRVRTLKIGDAMPASAAAKVPQRRKRGSAGGERILGLREAREPPSANGPGWAILRRTRPSRRPAGPGAD